MPSAPPDAKSRSVRVAAVGERDGLVFDVDVLLDAPLVAPRLARAGLRGGDPVDGQQPEFAQQVLVVHAAECGVVDDALRARDVGCEAGEAVDGAAGFAAGGGDPFDVEDDAAVDLVGARGDEHELGAPRGVAVAFEMDRGVGLVAGGEEFAGGAVEALVAGLRPEERCDDLAVRVEHATQVGMRPRAWPVGIEESELAGLSRGEAPVEIRQRGEDLGVR